MVNGQKHLKVCYLSYWNAPVNTPFTHTHAYAHMHMHAHIQSKRLRAVRHYFVVHEKKQMIGHVNDTEIQYSYAGWTKKHQQTKHCHPPTFHAVSNVLGGFDLRHLLVKWHVIWHQVIIAGNETKAHIFTDIHQLRKLFRHTTTIFLYVLFFTFQCVSKYVRVCKCVRVSACACLPVYYIGERGGGIFDDKFVSINIVHFDVGCF